MLLLRLREVMLLRLRPVIRDFDLTEQQARVLIVLKEAGSLEPALLADSCSIQQPSLARTLPKLCARGLVERRTPAVDQQRQVISLSPEGRGVTERLLSALCNVRANLIEQIGDDRMRLITTELRSAILTLGDPSTLDGHVEREGMSP